MDPFQVTRDPIWHRWVDGIVISVIGIAAGLVIAQGVVYQETTITTDIIRQVPKAPQIESGLKTDVPSGVRIEES